MTRETLKGYKSLKLKLKRIDEQICREGFLPELKSARNDILRQMKVVERFISECSDPVAYTVMRHKYLEGLTWQQTAMRIGGNISADGCRMIVNRILKRN